MKKLIVLFLFFCLAGAGWQRSGSIALPKAQQVLDLTTDSSGEIWYLAPSSISKIDEGKGVVAFGKVSGKCLAILGQDIYLLDQEGRLVFIDSEGKQEKSTLIFNNPRQMVVFTIDEKPMFLVLEPGDLNLANDDKIVSSILLNAERIALVPGADYGEPQTPFFTLSNNQIKIWHGDDINNLESYKEQLLFNSSDQILDFSVDGAVNLYILFPDSMVVLDSTGTRKSRIGLENIGPGSRLIFNSRTGNLLLFNANENVVETFSRAKPGEGELIVLKKNYPNPVDDYTEIEFILSQPLNLTLTIYNLIGEPVKVLARGNFSEGRHKVIWHAEDERGNLMPNGVYFYRLESEKGVAIRQLVILR